MPVQSQVYVPGSILDLGGKDNLCDRTAILTRESDGHQVVVMIADRCNECSSTEINVSPFVFDEIAGGAEDRVKVTFTYEGVGR